MPITNTRKPKKARPAPSTTRPRTTRSDLRHMASALTLLAALAKSAAEQVPRTSRSKALHPSWLKLMDIATAVRRIATPVAEPPAPG